jgi:hypothetical protein
MTSKLIYSIILLFVLASVSFAQGEYLKRGESATEIGMSAQFNNESSAEGFYIRSSSKGTFDIGCGIFQSSQGTILAPVAVLHIFKEISPRLPLSVSIWGQSELLLSTYDVLRGGDLRSKALISYGPFLYTNIALSKSVTLQPNIQASYTDFRDPKIEDGKSFGVGISFFFEKVSRKIFRFDFIFANINSATFGSENIIGFNIATIFRRTQKEKTTYPRREI